MKQYLIIGNSAAGISAVEAIRAKDKTSKITIISDEDYPSYCRCLISYYLAGDIKEEKILLRPDAFYKENNIELILNKRVDRVNPKKNQVVCVDKTLINYDTLLIATGARPKFPEIKGIKKTGVFGFRTIQDAKKISEQVNLIKSACVLGGGLVGLKAAYGLKKRKVDVKVIVKSKQILSQMLDAQAASMVQKRLEENGIDVILGRDITEVIGEGEMKAVKLDSGKALECSLLVVGKGVQPNMELVKETEIKVGEGIITGKDLKTNVENIFSAGDVCENYDLTLGKPSINALWPVAVEQGKAAGSNMAGENIIYDGSLGMNSIEFFGLPVISLGIYKVDEASKDYEVIKVIDDKANLYKKIVLHNNNLVGAVFAGDIRNSGVFLKLIKERVDVTPFKDKLLEENFGFPGIIDFLKDKERIYV
ncbi:MAG: FAD-dependent oxidoreductase [Candidatus Omnitrophica bacterium]|nr:FAD-dependent oxidoreductase [Candidatus Omnitrophota bacterium]